MRIDTSKLVPNSKMYDKSFDVENFRTFMASTAETVRQVLKDKEEYKERRKRTKESEGDS